MFLKNKVIAVSVSIALTFSMVTPAEAFWWRVLGSSAAKNSAKQVVVNPKLPKAKVYRFKTPKNGNYTGKTVNFNQRMNNHRKTGKLTQPNNKVKTLREIPREGKGSIKAVEKTNIRTDDILSNGKTANYQHAPLTRKAKKAAR